VSDADAQEDVVELTRLGDLTVARMLCGRLAAEGITAFLPDERMADQTWHVQGSVRGIRVQVARADLDRAKEILTEPALELGPEAITPGSAADATRETDDGTISVGDRAAFRALRVALVTLILPGVVHPYSLWLAACALRRPDVTAWGRGRAIAALAVSCAGCAGLAFIVYRLLSAR
jgi:hypothetical protein